MEKNKFDFGGSKGLTDEQTTKLTELMAVLEKANNQLKSLISGGGEKVDTRILTPVACIIQKFNISTDAEFIRWFRINQNSFLGMERRLYKRLYDDAWGSQEYDHDYFEDNFKQTP